VKSGLAVLDSSALIIFHQIDRLDLLRVLFEEFIAPPAVAREIAPSLGALPHWVTVRQPATIPGLAESLDPGEREAIALAAMFDADVVVLDELAGRRTARRLGLNVIGSAGLLVRARRLGLIDAVQPELDAMILKGLFVSRRLYREILETAKEPSSTKE
jgi:predicted nucleic acid-binding protein